MTRGRILVVEDDPAIGQTIALILSEEGYTIATAGDGAAALVRLRVEPVLPNLIVLDLLMPALNGEQFLMARAQQRELRRIPVILLSAHPQIATVAQRWGVAGYFPKPFALEAFLTTVARICDSGKH